MVPLKFLLAFAVLIGLSLLLNLANDRYATDPVRPIRIVLDSFSRFLSCFAICSLILLDYLWNFRHYPDAFDATKTHPDSLEQLKHIVHKRSAERLLKLALSNGGLFIKGGQYVASMNHMLPKEYTSTLSVLQDTAPWRDYETINRIFLQDLGVPISQLFSFFAKEPIAAASLAQVHYAVTKDGQEVAVKIQYPELRDRFEGDMTSVDLMMRLAAFFFPKFDFAWMNEEMRTYLSTELDFVHEGMNGEKARANMQHDPVLWDKVHVPNIFWDMTSKRILVAEYIHGVKITDVDGLKSMHVSPYKAVELMIRLLSDQIYNQGFVHCDPHPGNIFVRHHPTRKGDFQIVLLDHGLYREISEEVRYNYAGFWKAAILKDDKEAAYFAKQMGIDEWHLFAMMVLMRSYEGATKGLGSRMKLEDIKRLQKLATEQMDKFMLVLRQMPRELILIIRNHNLMRATNHHIFVQEEAGIPPNRFVIMARAALRGLTDLDKKRNGDGFLNNLKWLRQKIMFEFSLTLASLSYWSTQLYSKMLEMIFSPQKDVLGEALKEYYAA